MIQKWRPMLTSYTGKGPCLSSFFRTSNCITLFDQWTICKKSCHKNVSLNKIFNHSNATFLLWRKRLDDENFDLKCGLAKKKKRIQIQMSQKCFSLLLFPTRDLSPRVCLSSNKLSSPFSLCMHAFFIVAPVIFLSLSLSLSLSL